MSRERTTGMAVVTMRQLLESGVHFGHQTRRWNPKMKRFIMTERNGIYIIDLQQSLAYIDRSYAFIKEHRRQGRHRDVRRHQEAGAGGDRRAGDPRRHALRQPALARRHAHQLPDRAPADQPPQGARRDRLRQRRRHRSDQEGAPAHEAGARQARPDPGRHPGDDAAPRRRSGSSTPRRSTSPSRRRASSASRSSGSWTPTATPTRSTSRSPATTTRSAPSGCSPGWWPTPSPTV